MKTKLYSKQQIEEAISFWTKILENTSPLIDALVEDFGYDVVFGEAKIIPTLKMIEDIYDIINVHLFQNKLVKCSIEKDMFGYCKKEDAAMGYNSFMYEDPSNPDTYTLLTQTGQDSAGNIYQPPAIYVADETLDTRMSIIAIASIIAHEMMHQYNVEIGDECKKEYDKDKHNIPYDSHKNDEFIKWQSIANGKLGLHVTEYGSKCTYDIDSVDALRKFAGSDYTKINEQHEENDGFTRKMVYGTGLIRITYF